jgi:uncharacterized repeat protein (TIGR03806 family)
MACGIVLAACGGGPDTVQNDPPPTGGDPPPTNPPPTNPPPTNPPPTSPATSGLDARLSNTSCLAPNEPVISTSIALSRVFPNLNFSNPVLMLQAPGDDTKWYVVEQQGIVSTFANVDNTSATTEFINIDARVNSSSSEGGLLGMAFDPSFASTGRVYLSYTADAGGGGGVLQSRISRFTMSGGVLNPGSEEILLTIQQPYTNHNGGNIAFGPDGYLYIGFGDGGNGGDPQGNGQKRSTLLGKMLRIDVSGNGAYTIPADNPFVGAGTARCQSGSTSSGNICQEIYAYGFRNPWRWSFDRGASSPDLWVGDVGQDKYEEVDRVERGGNYGWNTREGAHCYNATSCATSANGAPLIDPVAEYDHTLGISITGGYVYRGSAIASLVGRYVFADFGSGRIFGLTPDNSGTFTRTELLHPSVSVSSFAQGNDGELYVVDYGGSLNKIVAGSGSTSSTIKTQLSQTGCFDTTNPTQPITALIPYAPNAPFWSDGASKQRWIALPDGKTISVNSTTGDFDFPKGTVLVKSFTLNNNLIETRLFMSYADTGNWAGYTYRWNSSHTDATLVTGGLTANIGGQDWVYPSEAQCLQCHTSAAGRSLGLEMQQLNSSFTYPSTGRTANQIDTLQTIGAFTAAPTKVTAMPDPADTTALVADRARAYLHTNCSQCHRPSGGTPVSLDLRYTTAIADTKTCNVAPASGDLGVSGAKVIAPGDSTHSVLYLRMSRRDANQMPPVASHKVDTDGAALLQQWINGRNGSCQ